jgi:hypothetical protein
MPVIIVCLKLSPNQIACLVLLLLTSDRNNLQTHNLQVVKNDGELFKHDMFAEIANMTAATDVRKPHRAKTKSLIITAFRHISIQTFQKRVIACKSQKFSADDLTGNPSLKHNCTQASASSLSQNLRGQPCSRY